jgi:hypothetical protein
MPDRQGPARAAVGRADGAFGRQQN